MTQVKMRLIGKTRKAVEEVLAHLEETASVQEQRWSFQRGGTDWCLDATLALPAAGQPSKSGSERQPVLVEELDWPAGGLSSHTRNTLARANIRSVEKLLEMPEEQLHNVRNLGPKGIQVIVDCLKQHGVYASSALAKTWPD